MPSDPPRGTPPLAPAVAGLVRDGFAHAYPEDPLAAYGAAVGRTLGGAPLADALPEAPGRPADRSALAAALGSGFPGLDHAFRGGLADGMAPELRARINAAALDALVARDPTALLDLPPDLPREHLAAWQALGSLEMPAAVTERLDTLNAALVDRLAERLRHPGPVDPMPETPWRVLSVENARGGVVNLDYFAVTVERMPEGVTPGQLLNHVRKHLNDFVDTRESRFAPYPMDGEAERWASRDPLASVVTIDIPGDSPMPDNDGSVIVSSRGADHWTFTTVTSPRDGLHPVSGNRAFGYAENGDGSVTFYTRGVDRITDSLTNAANWATHKVPQFEAGIAFDGADALWASFQSQLESFVEREGGRATIQEPIVMRPEWRELRAVVLGHESVASYLQRSK